METVTVREIPSLWDPLFVWCLKHPLSSLTAAYTFFTTWGLTMQLLLPTEQRWLAVLISMGGAYITHIHPRCLSIHIRNKQFLLEGAALVLVDILTHQLPLIYCMAHPKRITRQRTAVVITVGYLLLVDVTAKYGLDTLDMIAIGALCVVLVWMI
jgi:hypothetical protein